MEGLAELGYWATVFVVVFLVVCLVVFIRRDRAKK